MWFSQVPPSESLLTQVCQGHSHPKLLVALGMGSKLSAENIQPTAHKLMVMGNTPVWFPGH